MFKRTREKSPYFHLAMDFGYTLLASVLVFGYFGYWLDNRYDKSPLFLISGIFLGLAVGFNSLFRRLNMLEAKRKAAKAAKKPNEPKSRP